MSIFIHNTSTIDDGAIIGDGSKIWHYSHISSGSIIGDNCVIGQNCYIADTRIGNGVKVQNNVSLYSGVTISDDVFLGPSCVFTNITNPRSQVLRHNLYEETFVLKGATIGANATIVCGITIGKYAFIGAGSVVTKSVRDYALIVGNPGRQIGWMSRHGQRLKDRDKGGNFVCPESGFRYKVINGILSCIDLDEDAVLPVDLCFGKKRYIEFK